MASQAPSPAAAVEGGGQEVVEQDPQSVTGGGAQGGSAEDNSAPGEVAAPEPKPRARKEKLPGVVSRDDAEDIFPDLGFKSKTGKRVSRAQAMRELDQEMKEENDGRSPFDIPEPPEGAQKPEEAKPQVKKFKFGDKEYDTIEQAEQSFRSLQGMFKPLQERATQAEQLAEKAAESARAWRQRAMELEGGIAAPTPQRPTPQVQQQSFSTSDPKADLEAALANVNGELFESLAREHGLPLAGRYLAAQVLATVNDQMLPRLRQEIMDQLAPELEPLKQDRGFQQATQHVAGLIEQVGQYKNADGSDAFPELSDEQTVFEIGDLWRSMDMPAELALTPKGLLQAIALYRMYRGGPGAQSSTNTVEVSRPETTAPSPATQSLESGRSQSPMAARGNPASTFGRSLDEAPLVDPILGFSVRRRR